MNESSSLLTTVSVSWIERGNVFDSSENQKVGAACFFFCMGLYVFACVAGIIVTVFQHLQGNISLFWIAIPISCLVLLFIIGILCYCCNCFGLKNN